MLIAKIQSAIFQIARLKRDRRKASVGADVAASFQVGLLSAAPSAADWHFVQNKMALDSEETESID